MPAPPWYWTHDAGPEHVARPGPAPWRVARVAAYGPADRRRFATLVHGDPGPAHTVHPDLTAVDLTARADAVAVSVSGGRFTVVAEPGRAVPSRALAGASAAQIRERLAAGERLLDVDAYATADGTRYAAVFAADGPGTHFFGDLTLRELRRGLRRAGVRPVRLRAYAWGALFAAAGGDLPAGRWYTGLSADQVGRRLDRRGAWPVDLDAETTPAGIRYTLVMQS
ncbi:hypothetical protein [Dactylosporangium matsuzakiense]|uniref:Uncharacterized protein n=1 Tax=Dactylosporangium matsuzakiense TaxID=53360 RepID=A0A9W6KI14_9ACTN|nr:hypothetical protein [Dactylosporangium matsuzakiense]UWZ48893.1 hypothetical protein Dmats_22335 [Dactylosporangium matsuzakiense]GLL00889.1 hypothetical protein GCM10017581_026300 [Dactylosporangium matsuzakiense]